MCVFIKLPKFPTVGDSHKLLDNNKFFSGVAQYCAHISYFFSFYLLIFFHF